MSTVNVKIGDNIYNYVSTINVDKAEGGSANFIYEGNIFPYVIKDTFTNYSINSLVSSNEPILTTSIELR